MELKLDATEINIGRYDTLLIVPNGIEMTEAKNLQKDCKKLLIVPNGIEMSFSLIVTSPNILLIVPNGIEMLWSYRGANTLAIFF